MTYQTGSATSVHEKAQAKQSYGQGHDAERACKGRNASASDSAPQRRRDRGDGTKKGRQPDLGRAAGRNRIVFVGTVLHRYLVTVSFVAHQWFVPPS
jgi:hypothetical protein